jgi:Uma2 family endonuclease
VTVVCGTLERDRESSETILNPVVIAEILSEGTERYDRGEKFEHYQRIASLREYVLVTQTAPRIEVWHRDGGSWSRADARAGGRVALRSISCELVLDEIYRGVFEP